MSDSILEMFISAKIEQNGDAIEEHKLFVRTWLVTCLALLFNCLLYSIIEFYEISIINFICFGLAVLVFLFYYMTGKFKQAAVIICVLAVILFWLCSYSAGGILSPMLPWLLISMVFAFLSVNILTGFIFTFITFLSIVSFYILKISGIELPKNVPIVNNYLLYITGYGGFIIYLLILMFLVYYKSLKDFVHSREIIRIAKEENLNAIKAIEAKNIELEAAKNKAELSAQAKAQFLSSMSHEIRTPMNSIIGMTSIIMEENPRPQQIDNLKILKFSADSLLALINDILDFSKIDAGKIDIEQVDFNFNDLINGIVNSQNVRAVEKNIFLKSVVDPSIPEMLIGDPTRLSQILINLIGNSVKFTQKGGINVDVVLEKNVDSSFFIKFTVSDTGIGIAENMKDHIFASFTQGDKNITRRFGGTGLGLAITKKLLELQNSKIYVDSKLGEGSQFYFTLEFKKSNVIISHETKSPFGKQSYASLKGVKILLVEDNAINQMIAGKFLSKWDIEVDTAENGLIAIDMIGKKDYHMVLMDLQMPVLDGYEATDRIRKMDNGKYAKLPIIALTASAMLDVFDRIIITGMDDYVTKPFIPNELYSKIKKWSGLEDR